MENTYIINVGFIIGNSKKIELPIMNPNILFIQ